MLCAQAWKPSSQHAGEKRGVAGLLLGRTESLGKLKAGQRLDATIPGSTALCQPNEIRPFVLKGTTNGLSLGGDLSLKDFLLWE